MRSIMGGIETGNLLTWLGAIALIGGFGLAVMVWAYVGAGSRKVVFAEPVSPTATLPDTVATPFEQGCDAYRQRQFARAIARFTDLLQTAAELPAAHHNLGRLQANVQKDNEAVRSLVRAGELYLEQGNSEGYAAIKADLETLKQARV
jgi:hypothetical protein